MECTLYTVGSTPVRILLGIILSVAVGIKPEACDSIGRASNVTAVTVSVELIFTLRPLRMVEIAVLAGLKASCKFNDLRLNLVGNIIVSVSDSTCADYHTEKLGCGLDIGKEAGGIACTVRIVEAADLGIVEVSHPADHLTSVEIVVKSSDCVVGVHVSLSRECKPMLLALKLTLNVELGCKNSCLDYEPLLIKHRLDKCLECNLAHTGNHPVNSNILAVGVDYVTAVFLGALCNFLFKRFLCRESYCSVGFTEYNLTACSSGNVAVMAEGYRRTLDATHLEKSILKIKI